MEAIKDRLSYNLENKRYCYFERKIGNSKIENKFGFVIDFNDDFVILQETDDFEVCGYSVIPINTISKVRFNNNDKYYDKIMHCERLTDKIVKKHNINLSNWESIFKSIKKLNLNVIIENENPNENSFDIGPITKVSKDAVYIRYFNAQGLLNTEPSKIIWSKITTVKFDDRYINIFSKYLRERKEKSIKNNALPLTGGLAQAGVKMKWKIERL